MAAVNVIYIKPILLYFYYSIYLRSTYTIQIRHFVFYNPGSLEKPACGDITAKWLANAMLYQVS